MRSALYILRGSRLLCKSFASRKLVYTLRKARVRHMVLVELFRQRPPALGAFNTGTNMCSLTRRDFHTYTQGSIIESRACA